MKMNETKVWNFDLPPYPREGLFHLDMSEHCQINRLLKWEASRLAHFNQLDHISNAEEHKKYKSALRKKLWQKFGTVYDPALPLEVRQLGTLEQQDFILEKLIFQSRPGVWVTALLYRPRGKGPFPAVLQMHGHNPEGKFGINVQNVAQDLVKNGIVCLCVDAIGCFERAFDYAIPENHGNIQGAAMLNIGETLLGYQVVENMRAVDLLLSLDYVRKDRIGATGGSGGGNQTMYLAAMDDRIAAAMPVVSVGSFQSCVYGMNCMCELLPDALTFTEISGILALIAPRPLHIGNALYDCNHDFSVAEMLKSYHPVEQLYRNLGASQNISFYVSDRPHGYTDRQRESAIGFFKCFLKNEGRGCAEAEPENHLFSIDELRLFSSQEERPPQIATIPGICLARGTALRQEMLERKSISASPARRQLKNMLRMKKLPADMQLKSYHEVNGVKRYALMAGDHLIPFLVKEGRISGKLRILLHPEGKSALSAEDIERASADGSALLMPDLFGTGETAQPNHCIGLHHQFFRQLLFIGRTLIGEWVWDILTLTAACRRFFKAKEISLYGVKECGTAGLMANVFEKGFSEVTAVNSPASYLFDHRSIGFKKGAFEKFLPGAIYCLAGAVPGFLKWGDISLLQALGNSPVIWLDPRSSDGTRLDENEKNVFEKEVQTLSVRITS